MYRIASLAFVALVLGAVAGVLILRTTPAARPPSRIVTVALPPEAPAPAPSPALQQVATAAPARADAPGGGFLLPIDCKLGDTCWILNYFDVDVGPAMRDFRLRARTYNGHDGVDIAIRDMVQMAQGVAVLASAAGTVIGMREGETDSAYLNQGAAATTDRHCGNGVALDHGGGWVTQYCHMRQGSIAVKMGDRIAAGQRLGLVGMTGDTAYPHIHLAVRRNGVPLDPFTGNPAGPCCTAMPAAQPLWAQAAGVVYHEVDVFSAAFTSQQAFMKVDGPRLALIRGDARGEPVISRNAPVLAFYAALFGVDAGDRLRLQVFLPDGAPLAEGEGVIAQTQVLHVQARTMTRPQNQLWPVGRYRGVATIESTLNGQVVRQQREGTVEIR